MRGSFSDNEKEVTRPSLKKSVQTKVSSDQAKLKSSTTTTCFTFVMQVKQSQKHLFNSTCSIAKTLHGRNINCRI